MLRSRFTVRLATRALIAGLSALAAPAAFAYSATIEALATSSSGFVYIDGVLTPVQGVNFPDATYSSTLPQPLTVSRDPSTSFGPTAGVYASALGRYEATVAPGGIHIALRSLVAIDAQDLPFEAGVQIRVGGTLATRFADDLRITLNGVPDGTPFLMTVLVRLDGTIGNSFAGGAQPFLNEATAAAGGYWGFDLIYGPARPPGVPSNLTNGFIDGSAGLIAVRHDRVLYDHFETSDLLGLETVTFYGVSGAPATLDMFINLEAGARASITGTGLPNSATSIEAGLHLALDHTFAWGGIASINLLDGTPISLDDVTSQSSSGFDYRNAYVAAVPEPASAALLALAAAALVGSRMRRAAVTSPNLGA